MNFNLDLALDYKDEIKAAVNRVIDSNTFVNGPELKRFEHYFATDTGQAFSVGVGSGTDAIRFALLALGIKPGDEVITSAHGVAYTALAIQSIGAIPIFADVDPKTKLLDPWDAERKITPKTRAILPVHLYGLACDMKRFRRLANDHGLVLVEDAAQAHFNTDVGHNSHATAYSFYPTKNLGAYGEGGAVTSNLPIVAERVRLLRDAGRTDRYVHVPPGGLNSMLDELQAAVLNVRLRYRVETKARRQAAHAHYWNQLDDVALYDKGLRLQYYTGDHVAHLFVIFTDRREELHQFLGGENIPTLMHYPITVPAQPIFAGDGQGPFPHAEETARTCLSLPLHPDITRGEQDRVIAAIRSFFG